jgi:hypothetical protein
MKWLAGSIAVMVLIVLGSLFAGSLILDRSHPPPAAQSLPVTEPSRQTVKAVIDNRNKTEITKTEITRTVGALSKRTAGRWLSALLGSNDYRARAAGLFFTRCAGAACRQCGRSGRLLNGGQRVQCLCRARERCVPTNLC